MSGNIAKSGQLSSKRSWKCAFCTSIAVAIFGILIFIVSLLFMSIIFPKIFNSQLAEKLPLRDGSDTFKNWQNSAVPIYMKFNLFNVTNLQAVLNGEKPIFKEIGPYSYIEKRQKMSYKFLNDGQTLAFTEKKSFFFDPETSMGDPFKDKVVTINPFIATLFANINHRPIIETVINQFHFENIFMSKTVNEALWGYEDPIIADICDIFGLMCDKKVMGFLVGNNASVSATTSINTGVEVLEDIGLIQEYAGQKELNIWNSDIANAINGSDGTMFKPGISDTDTIYVFASDVCRSFQFEFKETVQATNDGRIQLLQFVGTKQQAQNATVNPFNRGFCPKKPIGPECPPGGLMDLSPCRSKGDLLVPLVASQPHFYLAEPWVSEPYEGIKPGSDADSTQLNIEPHLGVPLEAYKRLQMNFYLHPDERLKKYFGQMPIHDYYFPLFWLEEGATADSVTLGKLYDKVIGKARAAENTAFAMKLLGPMMLVLGTLAAFLLVYRSRKNFRPKSTEENSSSQPMLHGPKKV